MTVRQTCLTLIDHENKALAVRIHDIAAIPIAEQLRIETIVLRAGALPTDRRPPRPTAAVTALTQLLTDRLRVLGPNHPNTLKTRADLASWRSKANDQMGRP